MFAPQAQDELPIQRMSPYTHSGHKNLKSEFCLFPCINFTYGRGHTYPLTSRQKARDFQRRWSLAILRGCLPDWLGGACTCNLVPATLKPRRSLNPIAFMRQLHALTEGMSLSLCTACSCRPGVEARTSQPNPWTCRSESVNTNQKPEPMVQDASSILTMNAAPSGFCRCCADCT